MADTDADDDRPHPRETFGGFNWGSAFFGWLVATGVAVLLLALIAAIGGPIAGSSLGSAKQAAGAAPTIGIVGGIVLLIALGIAYFAGGYVAGRMSRFDGGRQGLGVWIIGLVATIPAVLAVLCLLLLAQPVAADWRSARLLGHTDTRVLARAWLERHYPPELRIAIEPEVSPLFYRSPRGRVLFRRDLERAARGRDPDYSRSLSPATVDGLRATGTCLVMTLSYVRGRVERDRAEPALSFYRRLEHESRPVFTVSPARPGERPPPFDFDLSYNGYSPELVRPGPEVRVLRLDRCHQGLGPLSRAHQRALGGPA
jgi:hypothetical protein